MTSLSWLARSASATPAGLPQLTRPPCEAQLLHGVGAPCAGDKLDVGGAPIAPALGGKVAGGRQVVAHHCLGVAWPCDAADIGGGDGVAARATGGGRLPGEAGAAGRDAAAGVAGGGVVTSRHGAELAVGARSFGPCRQWQAQW